MVRHAPLVSYCLDRRRTLQTCLYGAAYFNDYENYDTLHQYIFAASLRSLLLCEHCRTRNGEQDPCSSAQEPSNDDIPYDEV